MASQTQIPHPGTRIRAEIIPARMSVTRAAKLLDVSRPALSNLLNGNASLSVDMAARLAKVFGTSREKLMTMQITYDEAQAGKRQPPITMRAYIPPFLSIRANEIEAWVTQNIQARARFSVLLRTLIHSTGSSLVKVAFPGNDDSERPGWDGWVEANEASPWIPIGNSGWEFGTNINVKAKAESDFKKSVEATSEDQRRTTTFIFVTPRRWPGKEAWSRNAAGRDCWKNVHAYDASDIEQWLEQSLAGQAWFANETLSPTQDVRSLDRCWSDWADVTDPPLSGALFNAAIEVSKRVLSARLLSSPDGPTIIKADSIEEALAFLSQVLGEKSGDTLVAIRDRVLVFDKPGTFPRLAQATLGFIPVAFTRDVEREFAAFTKVMNCIIIYPRNAPNVKPHIVLEPAEYQSFCKALQEMKKGRDEASQLARASGRSLTVLRRRLSTVPAMQIPGWAANPKIVLSLIALTFVGAWDSDNETDQAGLSLLADERSFESLEEDCRQLSELNDAPTWLVGSMRGVVSKHDLLYAISGAINRSHIERYFEIAKMVLGEDDPALDLTVENRWAASIYGKTREFSNAFRTGICETLVLLAVHGNNLFQKRLRVDVQHEVTRLIRSLLPSPLTTRKLEANDRDLPTYAEADPSEFLSIIEEDLRTEQPAVLGLLQPMESGVFGGHPTRTGLLWALEGLCWSPDTLIRATLILGRLAQIEIIDNWINKPANSLLSVFRSWMPQTAASHQERVAVVKRLTECFPDVAWKICVEQFGVHHEVGSYSHKPRWRTDGYGFGEPVSVGASMEFRREMADLAIRWPEHSVTTLSDLVERLHGLNGAYQASVWKLIVAWAQNKASDVEKATLREKVRVTTSLQHVGRDARVARYVREASTVAKAARAAIEPTNILNRHAWLFLQGWVPASADETQADGLNHRAREERITRLRVEALSEVWGAYGYKGILTLAEGGKAARTIGHLLSTAVLNEKDIIRLLLIAGVSLANPSESSRRELVSGVLSSLGDDGQLGRILQKLEKRLQQQDKFQVLLLAPFRSDTWKFVDSLSRKTHLKYWDEVAPDLILGSSAEVRSAADKLLEAGRFRAAFATVRYSLNELGLDVLFAILSKAVTKSNDRPGHYPLDEYYVEQAFKIIDHSSDFTLEQKAGLEFSYIEVLARPWSAPGATNIPNLERYIEQHPEEFVRAIVWTYRRNDGQSDPLPLSIKEENIEQAARVASRLLDGLRRTPGYNDTGELKADLLSKWVSSVRAACLELGREEIADICIGKLLSAAPAGPDGLWPCDPVCQVVEEARSLSIVRGMQNGLFNARGAHYRGDDGAQERELAALHRDRAEALRLRYPYVSSQLLMGMVSAYEHEASREDMLAGLRQRLGR